MLPFAQPIKIGDQIRELSEQSILLGPADCVADDDVGHGEAVVH